ncbi:MAG: hypothetical protein OEZ34_12270 [Spirochaetia bacterium]|nr:hypothetical protein [Spirochaetia bacterium]
MQSKSLTVIPYNADILASSQIKADTVKEASGFWRKAKYKDKSGYVFDIYLTKKYNNLYDDVSDLIDRAENSYGGKFGVRVYKHLNNYYILKFFIREFSSDDDRSGSPNSYLSIWFLNHGEWKEIKRDLLQAKIIYLNEDDIPDFIVTEFSKHSKTPETFALISQKNETWLKGKTFNEGTETLYLTSDGKCDTKLYIDECARVSGYRFSCKEGDFVITDSNKLRGREIVDSISAVYSGDWECI